MVKITFQLVLVCLLLCSCKEIPKKSGRKLEKIGSLIEWKQDSVKGNGEMDTSNDGVQIKFPDLTVSLKGIQLFWWENGGWNYDGIYETEKDTAYFDLNPGEELFEKSFGIEQPEFDILELYGQFEMKVSLDTERELEVPVCILGNWKGYTSKWKKLKIDKKDLKLGTLDDHVDNPINFTLDEFKDAVEKHCGPEWLNDIKNINTLDKLPFDYFTTKYIYKMKVRNSKTNQVIEKFMVFNTPTSC